MSRLDDWCDEASFVDWEQTAGTRSDWLTAHQRLVAEGHSATLAHASAGQRVVAVPAAGRGDAMTAADSDDRRRRDRIKRRRASWSQAVTFGVITVVLVVIWALTGAGFFWPAFVMLGFAVALAAQARRAFAHDVTDADIDRELRSRQRP